MSRALVLLSLIFFISQAVFSQDDKKLNKLFSELKAEGDVVFATNVRNTISNISCGKNVSSNPEHVMACDYPSNENKRKDAKCFLIDQKTFKVIATSAVVYGQGGVAESKDFKIGKNQTPLGSFEISKPQSREKKNKAKEKSTSEIAMIVKSGRTPAQNTEIQGYGPIFYPDENVGFGSSLGSPVFFGSSAKNILSLLKESKKTLLFNSSDSTKVANLCK